MSAEFESFQSLVRSARKFVLTTHINPDGDGLGSECALACYLRELGKQVWILNHSETPSNYAFLGQYFPIMKFDETQHKDLVLNADALVVLDTNHLDRLASMKSAVEQSRARKVCIDHHLDPARFADLYILDESSTATGEVLYHLLTFLDTSSVSTSVASSLYAAIMTDTGSFRYPKTDSETHRIIAHLIDRGADPVEIYERVYEQGSFNRMRLLGEALAGMKIVHGGTVAYLVITRTMLKETGTTEVDTDSFVPYTMSIQNVQIGMMFTELAEGVKVNFRSKGDIRINELAKEFGGNGHKNAAGARVAEKSLAEVLAAVVDRSASYTI
ncbi:MAG: bifunctional oligoribonuclease/PAP phosphatase NrnA [Bacteroidota bacterium]